MGSRVRGMRGLGGLILGASAALWMLSCDEGAVSGGAGSGTGETDALIWSPEGDAAIVSDAEVSDMYLGASGFMEPCADNRDCLTGFCVPYKDRLVCSQACLTGEGCPEDWGCHAVANTRPDVVFICYPPGHRLCGACLTDADCPNGTCHEVDGQRVCGLSCDDEELLCPRGYVCGENGQCAPNNGSCTCNEGNAGEERLCEQRNEHGSCLGRETCEPGEGWVGCTASTPAPEICNGEDDDCNGLVDDIVGLGEVCDREAQVEGERYTCTGRLICDPSQSTAPVCTARLPSAELCNYIDDNCDGRVDEGFEDRGQMCVVGVGACQNVGVYECSEDGLSLFCTASPGEPSEELCNGVDDNCDGEVDEGFEGLGAPCEVGVGACKRTGFMVCSADGRSVVCSASPGEPSAEICNGIDDNCDGEVDEGFEGVNQPCSAGIGLCMRAGVTQCSADGQSVVCSVQAGPPGEELCNGVDDNCDGRIDEAFPDLNTPCSAGEGACQRAGVRVCAPDGRGTICDAQPGEPSEEICNGVDDNCDGEVDEGFEGVNQPCSAGLGACMRQGITQCSEDGRGITCTAQAGPPGEELCNGIDDNCDGRIDEAFPDLNTPCAVGVGACMRQGVRVCAPDGRGTICDAQPGEPSAEVCNGIDDNCDGQIDEGFVGLHEPCVVGVGLCRAVGVQVCAADGAGVSCNAAEGAPQAELCNGLDDNCDGRIDEAFPALNQPCDVGVGACRRVGVEVCSADGQGTVCDMQPGAPSEELCNGIDDNCDGQIDEAFPDLGAACEEGVGECRRGGVRICSGDGRTTTCSAQPGLPGEELCNYRDDNCDGRVDEPFVDAQGRYVTTAHCGACNASCVDQWEGGPERYGVAPLCELVGGIAQCGYRCLAGYLDADQRPGNGCELFVDPDAIYVATAENGGVLDEACGTIDLPCESINHALLKAQTASISKVLVSEGEYEETVVLADGIALLGGFHRVTWQQDPVLYITTISGQYLPGDIHGYAVQALDIALPTTLEGFTLRAPSPFNQGNSYGLYIRDSGPQLTVRNNRILAGDGGRGALGAAGQSGLAGVDGRRGFDSYKTSNPNSCARAAREGGSRSCDGESVAGGNGGGQTVCPDQPALPAPVDSYLRAGDGASGRPLTQGGGGGLGGYHMVSFEPGVCSVWGAIDAKPGEAGRYGADGLGGTAAVQSLGQVVGGHWWGEAAAGGVQGGHGSGGGGGGAAAGIRLTWTQTGENTPRFDLGATGGGGGSGGCAGKPGGAGGAGGGSFGVYIYFSQPAQAADKPQLLNNRIRRGQGGVGGDGGTGGGGGEGGRGGAGGVPGEDLYVPHCNLEAGSGGVGGRGGHGGGGGGGQGGVSADIFVVNVAQAVEDDYEQTNTFLLGDDVNTGGHAGVGGNASNTTIGLGANGEPGLFGHVLQIP